MRSARCTASPGSGSARSSPRPCPNSGTRPGPTSCATTWTNVITEPRRFVRGRLRLSTDVDLVIHVPVADSPDPEGRIGISAAVAGQRPAQALGVVFAVRRDDDRLEASPDPPAVGGKMRGQRYRFAV